MKAATYNLKRIAGFELNALRATEVLGEEYEKARISTRGTPIYDLNGTILFYRLPLKGGQTNAGYVDIAANEALGEPLIATSIGQIWDENELVKVGTAVARKGKRKMKFDKIRFVAYSFPKIALQFISEGQEVLMLELYTWVAVPPAQPRERKPLEPSNFERWSLLDELPEAVRKARRRNFNKRIRLWESPELQGIDPIVIRKDTLRLRDLVIALVDTREIGYSLTSGDHVPCYELRGQQTNVWCVAASVEMLLNFYRYSYSQVRLAQELGLGTLEHPHGLPYARVGDVVTVMECLTDNALDVTIHIDPAWNVFRSEIAANRPLISFIPGHSRTVAGYTRTMISLFGRIPFRGLLVYDPWPPNVGVITRWENFATQTYQYAYSSVLKHI